MMREWELLRKRIL